MADADAAKKPETSNRWNDGLEWEARRLLRSAEERSWIYERMVGRSGRLGTRLKIAAGTLALLTGTEGLASISMGDGTPRWLRIATGVVNFAVAALLVVVKVLDCDGVRAKALVAQVGYSRLARDVSLQLAQPPADRQDGPTFVEKISEDVHEIQLEAPTVYESVRRAAGWAAERQQVEFAAHDRRSQPTESWQMEPPHRRRATNWRWAEPPPRGVVKQQKTEPGDSHRAPNRQQTETLHTGRTTSEQQAEALRGERAGPGHIVFSSI
jgi:hypothetical protein